MFWFKASLLTLQPGKLKDESYSVRRLVYVV